MEMPAGGKPGNPKTGFPPFPPSLEIAGRFPHSHRLDDSLKINPERKTFSEKVLPMSSDKSVTYVPVDGRDRDSTAVESSARLGAIQLGFRDILEGYGAYSSFAQRRALQESRCGADAALPDREDFVEISQANVGLIRKDLLDQHANKQALAGYSTKELIAISGGAADIFLNDSLPLGDVEQTPGDYVLQIASTTGMPHVLARRNMKKIHAALFEMEKVLTGLTRGVPFEVLDRGFGDGLSFFARGIRWRGAAVEFAGESPFALDARVASGKSRWC